MKKIKECVIRTLGLKGSWSWAVRQMKAGHVVTHKTATGTIKYRASIDGMYRIQWDFRRTVAEANWDNAYIFLGDLKRVDWILYVDRPLKIR